MPKISVIVPIYKVEKYLHRCVDSILNQTFSDFELILVDDGSPDNCGEFCENYVEKNSRVIVIHKKNGGLSDARNVGIDLSFFCSNSKWITFVDSDDWIHQKYLYELFHAAKETKCEIIVCGYHETVSDEKIVILDDSKPEVVITENFFCDHNSNAVVAWGKLYKKSLFKNIRYPVGKLHEDEFTTYRIIFQQYRLAFLSQAFYFYFYNPEGITKNQWSPERLASIEALKEQTEYFYQNKFLKAYKFSIWHLTENIIVHFHAVEHCSDKKIKCYIKLIKKNLRYSLKQSKVFNMFPRLQYPYYYELAYPYNMRLFWRWKAITKKSRRK